MKKGWLLMAGIMAVFLFHPGCTCHRYHISHYFGVYGWGPELSPSPVIVENDSLSFRLLLKKGPHELRKNHVMNLEVELYSENTVQQIGVFELTQAEINAEKVIDVKVPLTIEPQNGIGQIHAKGHLKNIRNNKEMRLVGHRLAIVYIDSTAADKAQNK